MFALLVFVLFLMPVFGTSLFICWVWCGKLLVYPVCLMSQTPSSIVTNLPIPQTLILVGSYDYSACTCTMTATQSVQIGGLIFTADLITFTLASPSQSMFVIFQYPDVTITSLTPSETLIFVHPCFRVEANNLVSGSFGYSSRSISNKRGWIFYVLCLQWQVTMF
jgi:hypothetical protein